METKARKKAIFIGNSYVFYGNAVIRKGCTDGEIELCVRENDRGYFYQLCRNAGVDVNVINWTFGGHGLFDIFGGVCNMQKKECCGKNHEDYLTDRYYDYVIVSPSGGKRSAERYFEDMCYIKTFFERENPSAKFICLGNLGARGYSSFKLRLPEIFEANEQIKRAGWIIADWGKLVEDLILGNVPLKSISKPLEKDDFIVNRTENDGFHPNPLSGYIASLFAFRAVTGLHALGQPYDFCLDGKIAAEFDTAGYIADKYSRNGGKTSYPTLLKNEAFIREIQSLADAYFEADNA